MSSLEWRNEESRVAKSTISSGESYSLEWQMPQMTEVTVSSGECYSLKWRTLQSQKAIAQSMLLTLTLTLKP